MTADRVQSAADEVAKALDADVLLFNGQIDALSWFTVAKLLAADRRIRRNVLLTLVTPGGDPDAAFRIARGLQQKYEARVFTFIPGWCKSAGTLVTLASQKIFIGDLGELGPLDIQIAKADELFEMSSGFSVQAALQTLEQTASKMFINLLLSIRGDTGRGITTRTAAELASSIVGSLLEPIYRQIEPIKIGENQRAMSITKNYGTRLAKKSGILRDRRILDYLVSAYPDHGFVIDREEANELFNNVEKPTQEMERLALALGDKALYPKDTGSPKGAEVRFLSTEPPVKRASAATINSEGATNERQPAEPATRKRRASTRRPMGVAGSGNAGASRKRSGNGLAPNGRDKA